METVATSQHQQRNGEQQNAHGDGYWPATFRKPSNRGDWMAGTIRSSNSLGWSPMTSVVAMVRR